MASRSYQLVQHAGPDPGNLYSLANSEIFLGRDINNDIVINDAEVSRKHARLLLQPSGEYQLEDLGSTNGTYIDGQRITGPHLMYPGETIMLGDNVRFHFETVAQDPGATVAAAAAGIQTPSAAESPAVPEDTPPMEMPLDGQPAAAGQARRGRKSRDGMVWIVAGLGCLVLFLCILILGVLAFDYFNLYCTPPFNILFPCP
jgi:FHA domain